MWYINTMEYYAAINRNEIMSFAGRDRMKLEGIILSKQEQKTKHHMFSLISGSLTMRTQGGEPHTWGPVEGVERQVEGEH